MLPRQARHELLAPAEEQALITRHQSGDRAATDRLLRCNRGLVGQFVRKFSGDHDDLTQEGTIGLLTALDRYDASCGATLATYATYWIRNAVLKYWRRNGSMVRDISLDRTRLAPVRDISLDEPIAAEKHGSPGARETLLDRVADTADSPEVGHIRDESHAEAARAMRCLTAREREIVTRRVMGDETLQAVADDFGCSRERIRQVQGIAMRKMQRVMAAAE